MCAPLLKQGRGWGRGPFRQSTGIQDMLGFVIRRLVQAIPVLILITAIVFAVVYFIPGDPAAVVLGRAATPENLVKMRHQMGLDRPLPVRYGIWLSHMVQGDLGNSILSKQPVWT